jgi:hypothetical protein
MPSVGWSGVKLAAIGLWSSRNAFSGVMNHASPSGSPTDQSGFGSPNHPTSVADLTNALVAEWKQVPGSMFQHLVESLPRRGEDVIAAKGGNFFQFKLLYKILATNRMLYIWGIQSSQLCRFCCEDAVIR